MLGSLAQIQVHKLAAPVSLPGIIILPHGIKMFPPGVHNIAHKLDTWKTCVEYACKRPHKAGVTMTILYLITIKDYR